MLRLHDTALGRVTDLSLREEGKVSMYVCGPTVYDVPHIGHGRFVLVWDLLRRYLEWRGLEVRYVSNITDIEDKIIRKANEDGISTEEVVRTYEKAWWDAMDRLGVLHPDEEPHATAYVERMVDYIAGLIDSDHAYATSDGVYFDTASLDGYGLLARQSLESLRAGGGDRTVVGEDEKRSALDFALWKKAKPGEPEWESPWGAGRPGWHIECTVMALDLLGEDFDLHGGGNDLTFPHHENERAQALGAGRKFARYWVHSGMVVAEGGEKMSKSLNNFVSLTDMLERVDGRAYRLLVLQSHYRGPLQVTQNTIDQAERSLAGLDALARRFAGVKPAPAHTESVERFTGFLDDDFNTPRAMAVVFDLVRDANAADDRGDRAVAESLAATVLELTSAVGLVLQAGDADVDPETEALVAARDAARASRDFSRADEIRDELVARGWTVEDTAGGTRVHR
ncbi:MAG TPA: cysteine--tRNA ligase [Acidimicrobiales bacterium]|nr:cysteine--tRNA ligase [Acidimicrobiales bacterium]